MDNTRKVKKLEEIITYWIQMIPVCEDINLAKNRLKDYAKEYRELTGRNYRLGER